MRFARIQELIFPLGIISSVLVILVPLPSAILDVLLTINVSTAVIVLLTTIYVRSPMEFTVFPSLLLATTLGRLVLNVATTRLILTRGDSQGLLAAGDVVKAFGEFVAGDNIVVGVVVFSIVVIIQFVVITKGATRISEVAARFALDGMPGKQMAIDADLNAGTIDEKEAKRRREEVGHQADFFGAMDGASKFVRGDAIAGIIITIVNIVGGLIIGVWQGGMSFTEAGSVFTKLTIGDGLVSQVPAFLISIAAALLVTRSNQQVNLPAEFLRQLFSRPQPLLITAGFVVALIATDLPRVPLSMVALGCSSIALIINRQDTARKTAEDVQAKQEKAAPPPDPITNYLAVDPMEIELGTDLVRLADPSRGGDLVDRVQRVRQHVAAEIGIILPKVRMRDNTRMDSKLYRIKIADVTVAEGTAESRQLLALDRGSAQGTLPGLVTKDPTFGAKAIWIAPGLSDQAKQQGYTVVEPSSVITTHLKTVIRKHADEILTRDATKELVEQVKAKTPAVVDELIPGLMKLSDVQQVLQILLREGVSIRPLAQILETLGDHAGRLKDHILLAEHVRARLARAICSQYRDADNRLFVITLDPGLEDQIRANVEHNERGLFVRLSPAAVTGVCSAIRKEVEVLRRESRPGILLVGPAIRAAVRQITEPHLRDLVILSYNEVTRDTKLESMGVVRAT